MKEKFNTLCEAIKNKDFTSREFVLTGINLFLVGFLMGMFFSPKKNITIGSNNIGTIEDGEDEEE